jgi:hypothetical protein
VKSTVRAGGWDLGVRSGSVEIDALLRSLLGDRCRDDLDPPDNYSISAESASDGATTALPTFFVGHKAVLRTRSVPMLVTGLLANLATHEQTGQDGLLWLEATALLRADNRAVLAAPAHRRWVVDRLRSLWRVNLRYHPVQQVALDIATGELVIGDLDADPAVAGMLRADRQVAESLVPAGRYPIAGWAVVGGDSGQAITGAEGVLRTFSLVTNLDTIGAQQTLDTLGAVFARAQGLTASRLPDEVVSALGQLAVAEV